MNFKNKIIKIVLVLFTILIIWVLWTPFYHIDKDTGFIKTHWSGLSALVDERPFGIKKNYYEEVNFQGFDGPYLYKDSKTLNVYTVSEQNKLIRKPITKIDSIIVRVNNIDKDTFFVKPKEIEKEKSIYNLPEKLIAISDIEGNFNAFSSFLISNGIINNKFEWIYGKGHLLLLGDFVDRGENVTQVLWLIYKLEQEASINGGKVHFVLGNHEILNLQGRPAYANEKYKKIAQTVSGKKGFTEAYKAFFNSNNFLINWVQSKNAIVKIGDIIFVHGGISPKIISFKPTLDQINENVRNNCKLDIYSNNNGSNFTNFVNGKEGIYWYRGMASDYKYYDKIKEKEFDDILNYFGVRKCIIGHTINDDIVSDFNNKLIKIDVLHGQEKKSGKTKGILILNQKIYKINDLGVKTSLN